MNLTKDLGFCEIASHYVLCAIRCVGPTTETQHDLTHDPSFPLGIGILAYFNSNNRTQAVDSCCSLLGIFNNSILCHLGLVTGVM